MRKDLKMIAIDLDGTLLRDDCTISERTREAVEEAGRKGYLIVPQQAAPTAMPGLF